MCFFPLFLHAENLPYFCGFETDEDLSAWRFVHGNNRNRWEIGSAAAFKGERSLYISADGGATLGYVNTPALSVAYREFDLPVGVYV